MFNEMFDTVKAVWNGLLEYVGAVDVVVAFSLAILSFVFVWKLIKTFVDDMLKPSVQSYSGRSLDGVYYAPVCISTLAAVFGGKR